MLLWLSGKVTLVLLICHTDASENKTRESPVLCKQLPAQDGTFSVWHSGRMKTSCGKQKRMQKEQGIMILKKEGTAGGLLAE